MYANRFTRCSPSISESDIVRLEKDFSIQIPSELRSHYLMCNGGRPDKKCWDEEGWEPTCLKRFLPIRTANPRQEDFANENTLQNALTDLVIDGSHLPEGFIPFAEDWGGNYFCVDANAGRVFFFSMDCGDDFERGKRYLAPSLVDFIENLVEEE